MNKVNFFLDVENNSKNVETKFHGRRISVYEVIKSINVNFLFFRSIYFIRSIFAFFARFYFIAYLKRDDLDNLEMDVRNCWWYQGGACCRLTVTGITVLHMLNLFM